MCSEIRMEPSNSGKAQEHNVKTACLENSYEKSCPGRVTQWVRVSSPYAKVAGLLSGQGTYEKQRVNAGMSRATGRCFSLTLPIKINKLKIYLHEDTGHWNLPMGKNANNIYLDPYWSKTPSDSTDSGTESPLLAFISGWYTHLFTNIY